MPYRGRDKRIVGERTHEQQKAIIEKREVTKGADVSSHEPTLEEAQKANPPAPKAYDLETGDRSIQQGAHNQSKHFKNRSDD